MSRAAARNRIHQVSGIQLQRISDAVETIYSQLDFKMQDNELIFPARFRGVGGTLFIIQNILRAIEQPDEQSQSSLSAPLPTKPRHFLLPVTVSNGNAKQTGEEKTL